MDKENLEKVVLFNGISGEEIEALISCLNGFKRHYKKNEMIFSLNEEVKYIGIIIEGNIQIVQEDFFGNKSIIAGFGKGNIFAEVFCAAKIKRIPVSVVAISESDILFIEYSKIMGGCSKKCPSHSKLHENLIKEIALKNIYLNQKITFLSKRNTRDKLLAYLLQCATESESKIFTIPFNRQELADYLFIDRSAMSKELSKLKEEGTLDYHKNQFKFIR